MIIDRVKIPPPPMPWIARNTISWIIDYASAWRRKAAENTHT